MITNWILPHFSAVKVKDITPVQPEPSTPSFPSQEAREGDHFPPVRPSSPIPCSAYLSTERSVLAISKRIPPPPRSQSPVKSYASQPFGPQKTRAFLETVAEDRLYAL